VTDDELHNWNINPVLKFINKFYCHNGNNNEAKDILRKQFHAGYCYYFAVMIKEAFNRGEVCWCSGLSHIVWVDDDGTPYDIEGVNHSECEYYIPIKYMGEYINAFKHSSLFSDYYYPKTEEEANIYTKKIIKKYLNDFK